MAFDASITAEVSIAGSGWQDGLSLCETHLPIRGKAKRFRKGSTHLADLLARADEVIE